MVTELLAMRVTHVLAGGQRVAEIAPGVVCIDGHQVTSIAALISVGVTVDQIVSTDCVGVAGSDTTRRNFGPG
jgi:hypothetical protein